MSGTNVTLVTGGAGFIGSSLVRALVARGDRVIVYDNFSASNRACLPRSDAVVAIEGDVRDPARLYATLSTWRPTIVCHLAALHFIPYCETHSNETRQVNVEGTRSVLAGCRRFRPELLLFASSAAVYPVHDGALTEDHSPAPVGVYAETKLAGEDLVAAFARRTGTTTIIVRPFNVFGPNDRNPHLIAEIARQVSRGWKVRIGNLEAVRDYVHVDDLVTALRGLLRDAHDLVPVGVPAIFNIGSGEGRSVLGVLRVVEQVCGDRIEIVRDEARIRRVDPRVLVADIAKLKRATRWQPSIGFEEGIRQLLARRALALEAKEPCARTASQISAFTSRRPRAE